jgi:hypothetical protein
VIDQINKVRHIASALIEAPQNRKGPLALKSDEHLARFLDVLTKLKRTNPTLNGDAGDLRDVEEEELSHWIELRDYQMRFLAAGGFLSDG